MKFFSLFLMLFSIFCFSQEKTESFSIYFDSGSYLVSENKTDALISFLSKEDIIINGLTIEGFCDDIGSDDSNRVLSEKRAAEVAKIVDSYFSSVSKTIVGKGEILLESTISIESARSKNRRVEVAIKYSVADKVLSATAKDSLDPVSGYKILGDDLKSGDKIIINHLLFVASSTAFSEGEEAEAELQKIVAFFKENPNIEFEIHGHVCCITKSFKDARNIETGLNNLSKARAEKVYNYFVTNGIAKTRMKHQGFGRQFPRANVVEQLNKRVEIVITKI